ncbi:unnamed protein product, partial [Litomosoides sigmodontis]
SNKDLINYEQNSPHYRAFNCHRRNSRIILRQVWRCSHCGCGGGGCDGGGCGSRSYGSGGCGGGNSGSISCGGGGSCGGGRCGGGGSCGGGRCGGGGCHSRAGCGSGGCGNGCRLRKRSTDTTTGWKRSAIDHSGFTDYSNARSESDRNRSAYAHNDSDNDGSNRISVNNAKKCDDVGCEQHYYYFGNVIPSSAFMTPILNLHF